MTYTSLVIDDSAYSRSTIKGILEEAGYQVLGLAKNGEEALDQIVDLNPDFITLDNILPDMTGLQILKVLKQQDIKQNIIMVSAVGQRSVIEEAMSLGASAYLIKPFTQDQLLEKVKEVLKTKEAQ